MGRFRVQLILTGNVSAGTFTLPAALAQATYGSIMVNNLVLTNNNASVQAAACSVQTPSIPVVMPRARISALPTVGSTTGDTAIPISLNCDGPVSIYVTLTDASNPSNVGNTLSLTTNSSAQGVAYQILYGSTVINYGADSSAVGNKNQVKLGSVSAAGSFPVSLSARYVRTGAIVPGSANALATFTMSYQ
jgi:type 1 fimbria pilin